MKIIKEEKFNKEIKEDLKYNFEIEQDGLYLIEIIAGAKSWWQNTKKFRSFFRDDDLAVKINNREFPKLNGKRGLFDSEAAWNGNNLKGLLRTGVFIVYLRQGKCCIKFLVNQKPYLKSLIVSRVEHLKTTTYIPAVNNPAEDGNRRQWMIFIFIDLPIKRLNIIARAKKRNKDDDDLKLIIGGKIQKRKTGVHKNWYWCGWNDKGIEQEFSKKLNLKSDTHYVELWADRQPFLRKVAVELGKINKEKMPDYNDPVKIAEGFNPRYVLKDEAFNDHKSMSEEDIQKFLKQYHTVKNKPHISDLEFNGQRASYWIKQAADKYSINPRLLLSKLQAEQNLIKGDKSVDPDDYRINGAMGVGMYDGKIINEFQGFIAQITYAAKYFREYYNEAAAVGFTHPDVEGKAYRAVNAATFSLYKYTPFFAGPKLIYDVYGGLFSVSDLGGILKKDDKSGLLNMKAVLVLSIIIAFISMIGAVCARTNNKLPLFSWQDSIYINDSLELLAELEIFSEKTASPEDGLYCGYRFLKTYDWRAGLSLIDNGRTVDFLELTNPELTIPNLAEKNLTYYRPRDIDGDGNKKEFIVQKYASCNGHFLSFVRVNEEFKKLEKIPVIYKDGSRGFSLFVSFKEDAFRIDNGNMEIKFYNNADTDNLAVGFYKDYYRYDAANSRFNWSKREVL